MSTSVHILLYFFSNIWAAGDFNVETIQYGSIVIDTALLSDFTALLLLRVTVGYVSGLDLTVRAIMTLTLTLQLVMGLEIKFAPG